MKTLFRKLSVAVLTLLTIGLAYAGPVNVNAFGVAIDGYDTVAYFTENKAVRGLERYAVEHDDITWWFASEQNKALFVAAPERYKPQFAGHCANGLSDGHLVKGKPEIFRIIDNQLYLFYSWWGKAQWKYDQQEQINLATSNWLHFSSAEQ